MLANREIISKNREFWRKNSECAAARYTLKTFRFSFEGGPIAAMFVAAGATTGSRTLPHCAATSPLYPDVRYTPEGGHSRRASVCPPRGHERP